MAFTGRFVLDLIQFASESGVNKENILHLTGYSESELCNENTTLDNDTYNAVIENIVNHSRDPFFGLHAGEHLNLSAAGLIGQITQTSETIKQALEYCCEFANLGCSALPSQLQQGKTNYKVTYTPSREWKSPIAIQHTTDGVLAFTIKEFQSLTHHKHSPLEIRLPWKKPDNTSEYQRVFQCPVKFEQSEIAILLDARHVDEKIITSDYNLLRILVAHAQQKSQQMAHEAQYSAIVKRAVIQLMQPQFPGITEVSGHLNMSSRTLQRKLSREGVTYSELMDQLRREFAMDYLHKPELHINEVADLLGYADASAFIRSFKRWEGQTPNQYRNQALTPFNS
ncbi:AraC family transcriptional regulator ligand-binding domain-containing protein [bacterium SCSIO 12643]|nr:AraC family transcriptional regulator ligand-binding domain-containing protein [bacterium SCSIO 12643]